MGKHGTNNRVSHKLVKCLLGDASKRFEVRTSPQALWAFRRVERSDFELWRRDQEAPRCWFRGDAWLSGHVLTSPDRTWGSKFENWEQMIGYDRLVRSNLKGFCLFISLGSIMDGLILDVLSISIFVYMCIYVYIYICVRKCVYIYIHTRHI